MLPDIESLTIRKILYSFRVYDISIYFQSVMISENWSIDISFQKCFVRWNIITIKIYLNETHSFNSFFLCLQVHCIGSEEASSSVDTIDLIKACEHGYDLFFVSHTSKD